MSFTSKFSKTVEEREIMTDIKDIQKIIVLDYGSQYNQLIARRIREFGIFSELRSHKVTAVLSIQLVLSFQEDQVQFMLKMPLTLIRKSLILESPF